MSTCEEKLIRWVRGQMSTLTEEGIAQRLELFHVVTGQGSERIETIIIREGEQGYDDLAQQLWDAAEHDASTRVSGQPQSYVVASFRDHEEPVSQYRILMRRFSGHADLMGSDTEAPTETGIVSQQLRHTETLHRVLAGSIETLLSRQQNECERLTRRNTSLEEAHLRLIDIYAEAADRKAERELQQAEAVARARRHDQFMGLIMTVGPMAIAQMFGVKNPAGASVARDQGMQEFFERLTHEEMQGALTALRPTNRLALIEMFKSFGAAHSEEQQHKPEIFRDGNKQKEDKDEGEDREAPRH